MGVRVDPDSYKNWTADSQERALSALRQAEGSTWRPFYCPVKGCDGKPHDKWTWSHARADQQPPTDLDWLVWLLLGGRGAGKTESTSRLAHKVSAFCPRIAFIAPTVADLRDVTVEGESGLLATAAPGNMPAYEPSKRKVTWPNGARGFLYSAEEPERLRGPQHHWAFCDEAAIYPTINLIWDNLMFGLRLGKRPRVVVATTPKPKPWLKELLKTETTRVSRVSTYANLDNLAPTFADAILKKYEGTRLGRQELHAELLEDVEGALWNWEMIERLRIPEDAAPEMKRIVVGVDPAGSKKRSSDETGIVVSGIGEDGMYYVLADRSGKYSPAEWAGAVMACYDMYSADAIVVETNFGGDLVTSNLRAMGGGDKRIIEAHARRGKALRAEPVVSRYERGEVHHVGALPQLEDQMTSWLPYEDKDSPDRVDAMVYSITALMKQAVPASVSNPSRLRLVV